MNAEGLDRVRADVKALAAMVRGSAGPGERASAAWIARRLDDAGAHEIRIESFRYQSTYGVAHALHAAAGLLAARRGRGSWAAAALAAAALASLELDASGRSQWLRRLLPAGEGANAVARIPAAGEERRGTLVLVAHHDAARTGLVWHPALAEAGTRRRLRRRRVDPFMAPTALGLALAGTPGPGLSGLRRAGELLLWLSLAADLDIATSRTVPGASDNATGVAVMLELARELAADPLPCVAVLLVAPGCEESGMGGMAAFLRAHGGELEASRTLVLGLDTLGAGQPIVCSGEGTILEHRYRDEDLALADAGAARAGVDPPQRWRIGGWTDPILARFAGLPAISLLSIGPRGTFTNYHRPTDTLARVDWDSVAQCARLARGIARERGARAGE